eukprot:gene2428-biopygen13368
MACAHAIGQGTVCVHATSCLALPALTSGSTGCADGVYTRYTICTVWGYVNTLAPPPLRPQYGVHTRYGARQLAGAPVVIAPCDAAGALQRWLLRSDYGFPAVTLAAAPTWGLTMAFNGMGTVTLWEVGAARWEGYLKANKVREQIMSVMGNVRDGPEGPSR